MNFDIEGPAAASDATFVLGARPVTDGYDNNIGSQISAALFFASRAPAMFSGCVLACLESMEVTTTGTSVTAIDFDESSRQLVLNGPASPDDIQTVLRSLIYANRAPDINVESISVEVGFYSIMHVTILTTLLLY